MGHAVVVRKYDLIALLYRQGIRREGEVFYRYVINRDLFRTGGDNGESGTLDFGLDFVVKFDFYDVLARRYVFLCRTVSC